ncbi:hypothetical protein OPT61_g3136 [Boeremia exigua]|uniref:Uncharacterized protein n=1 Tax=Boeremia exigua TaxID=749465 RepID=A0ACC2IJ84_9PLEO|nr:hypothetical protein OPT61_g3136 [Boeremia exigua]
MTWPRPDIQQLGINYRRIPVLAIGRDIYCDTSLMLEKLETLFPGQGLSHPGADEKAQESSLERWSQSTLMQTAASLLPHTAPLLKDPVFLADRKKLWGIDFSPEIVKKARPNALKGLETVLKAIDEHLIDGRQWISGSNDIGMADIHVGFFFDWLAMIPGSLPEDFATGAKYFNARQYLQRYIARASVEREQFGPTATLEGAEAIQLTKKAGFVEPEGAMVDTDAGVSKGETVAVFRTDDLSGHKDVGLLLSLSAQESVIVAGAAADLRLHCPRVNFGISGGESTAE